MGRYLTDHKANDLNNRIRIEVININKYRLSFVDEEEKQISDVSLSFQDGPMKVVGANGISDESLIAVVIDRLRSFQETELKCRQNAIAITKLEEALMWMQNRTRDRQQRGVEGMDLP